jgi:hypothetical protein
MSKLAVRMKSLGVLGALVVLVAPLIAPGTAYAQMVPNSPAITVYQDPG